MRLVNYVALIAALSACNAKPTADAPSIVESAQPTALAEYSKDRLVAINRFDCFKSEDIDGVDITWTKGLSLWNGGGPGGASWNAATLICAVEFSTTCVQGDADVELRVGGAILRSQKAPLLRAGMQLVKAELQHTQWENHLDQTSTLTERLPYRTATVSAAVFATCTQPEQLGPGIGPRLEFADDRHFTAGFASGE